MQTDNPLLEIPLPYPKASLDLYIKIRHLPLPMLFSSGASKPNPAAKRSNTSRFDIISAAPEKILRTKEGLTNIEFADGRETISSSEDPIELLSQQFNIKDFGQNLHHRLPFTGGALGYFSYELLHNNYKIQRQHEHDIDAHDMLMGIYYWALIVDHQEKQCTLAFRSECSEQQQAEILQYFCEKTDNAVGDFSLDKPFESNFTKATYTQAYQQIIDYILAGDCYQVNLTQRFTADCSGDPLNAFHNLQERADAPFAAYIEDGQQTLLSFSPERFIEVKDKTVITQPIKGTRPRHTDPIIDQQNLNELKLSEKDKAENLMIVDLLRNDLGRVCKTGSVSVEKLFEAHSFTNVHHLISTIKSQLNHASDVFALLQASFPGGSITGTPKIRSMQIINELETKPRSVYCGAVSYIDFNGNMDSNICIRSLLVDQDKIHCWGGGAIVADSIAEDEYQESIDKISLFINNI